MHFRRLFLLQTASSMLIRAETGLYEDRSKYHHCE